MIDTTLHPHVFVRPTDYYFELTENRINQDVQTKHFVTTNCERKGLSCFNRTYGASHSLAGVDTITRHTLPSHEMQPQAMSELSYHHPNQPSQQDHTLSYPQPTQGKS